MKETTEGLAGWAKFITTVGVPAATMMYLVWQMTSGLASAAQVESVKTQLVNHSMTTERQLDKLTDVLETQVRLSRAICRSVAKTEAGRLECDR